MPPPPLDYAGFGRRLSAGLLDSILLIGFYLGVGWLASQSRIAALLLLPPLWAVGMLYEPTLHARFGATIGKFAVGIRVVRAAGGPINWRQSLIRSSVVLISAAFWLTSVAPLTFALPAEVFRGQGWTGIYQIIKGDVDSRYGDVDVVMQIWYWSEFATMLLNSKRRAIHDFMADTVVVKVARSNT